MPRARTFLTPFRMPYAQQRHSAAKRGIEWSFTLETWAAFWLSSGQWERRGRGVGCYCMARNGDIGSYAPENVRIILSAENGSEAFESAPFLKRARVTTRPTGVGGGHGCYIKSGNRRRPWFSVFRGKHIGYFETEDEARGAYKKAAADYLAEHGMEQQHVKELN